MWSSGVVLGCRYELEERIGAGGFSDVWRARDLILDRQVAVKLLHDGYARDAEALARFRAEARHAGSLAHENVARVYDYGESDPPYLVLELIDGSSLSQVLAGGPVEPARAMDVVAQAAAGLQAAHLAGLVHRDVKPGNLLLTVDGIVKITDFGISHAVGSARVTSTGLVIGTPGYLAPERAGGSSATAASDLYSLGVVAYECLAGAAPFAGTALEVALAHASRPFPALPAFIPADVAALVTVLTSKDPADRPRSAGEVAGLARQLGDRLAAGPGLMDRRPGRPPATAEGPLRRRAGRLGRRAAMTAAGAAVALIALITLVLANFGGPAPGDHPAAGSSPSTAEPRSPAVLTVDVNVGSLIGQPVSIAVSRLRELGLIPRVLWQPGDQQRPGRVTAVRPAGQLPVGSSVTVVGALQVPATAASSPQVGKLDRKGKGKAKGHSKRNGHGNGRGHE